MPPVFPASGRHTRGIRVVSDPASARPPLVALRAIDLRTEPSWSSNDEQPTFATRSADHRCAHPFAVGS